MIVGTYECPRCGQRVRFQIEPIEPEASDEEPVEMFVEMRTKPHHCRSQRRPHTSRGQNRPSSLEYPPYFSVDDLEEGVV